jgi:hypothetical protein
MKRVHFYFKNKIVSAGFLLLASVITISAQSISTPCGTAFVPKTCTYTIRVPVGEDVRNYTLSGFPQSATNKYISATNTKEYTTTWATVGSYRLVLRELGGPELNSITVNVYNRVGQVSIGSNDPSTLCQSVVNSSYTASATNAFSYSWNITPSTAGSISNTGIATWSASFAGTAKVNVTANGQGGDVSTASMDVTKQANFVFSAYINNPSEVCAGEPFTIGVITNNIRATFAWYERIDDGGERYLGSTANLPVTPEVGANYRVVVKPDPTITCLVNPAEIRDGTIGKRFTIVPQVNNLALQGAIPPRCSSNTTVNTLTASAFKATNYDWDISPEGAGVLTPTNYTESGALKTRCSITWNPTHVGTAVIGVTAYGCGSRTVRTTTTVRTTKLPQALSLSNMLTELCPGAPATVELQSYEANVDYSVVSSQSPAGLTGQVEKIGSYTWTVKGPGQYTLTAADTYGDCPAVSSIPQVINSIPFSFNLTASSGTIIKKNGDYILEGCLFEPITLTASGNNHGYKWYSINEIDDRCACRRVDDCRKNPWGAVTPQQMEELWLKNCRKLGSQSDQAVVNPGWITKMQLVYSDNVCNAYSSETIIIRSKTPTNPTGFSPDISERQQGDGTTSFNFEFTGPLYGLNWELSPPQAGSISQDGVVTWNPQWNSFLTDTPQPALVKANFKLCSGWESFPKSITVYPILDKDENRVRTYTALQPSEDYNEVLTNIQNPQKVTAQAGFFDGLGRNIQNVQYFGATSSKDIVELRTYDELGREAIKKLPYASLNTLTYHSEAVTEQSNFYTAPPSKVKGDNMPYSETFFEPSPLSRPEKDFGAGADWKVKNKPVQHQYLVNVNGTTAAQEQVIAWKLDAAGLPIRETAVNTAVSGGYYTTGQLAIKSTKDEQGNEVREYTNKEGQTILKKVQAIAGSPSLNDINAWAQTYYIYDDFGNLVIVLPPEAVKALAP